MGFGDSVTALLETYSNCLSLLKAFKRRDGEADKKSDQQSLLRKSLKADRNRVSRAYSSRLSESGSRLEKGDAKAKSALSRVLKRLRAAIVSLMHFASKNQNPDLDYQSLMSLSNASRVDAIRAIDQLSTRLGSTPSRRSLASSSTSSRHKQHKSSSSTGSTTSKDSVSGPSRKESKGTKEQRTVKRKAKTKSPKEDTERESKHASSHSHGTGARSHSRHGSGSSGVPVNHRISLISVSTDSTKLGEIPERKWRPRLEYYGTSSDTSSEYNVRPTYPLKPYKAEVKERRFWGLFRR